MLACVGTIHVGLLPYQLPNQGRSAPSATPDYSVITANTAQIPLDAWINPDLMSVGLRAETGVRKMRAAYKSAPDYARISGAMAAAALVADIDTWLPSPDAVMDNAEKGVRKMRAAYNSAPDYAKISGAMALAGVLAMGMDGPGIHNGFEAAVNHGRAAKVLAQFEGAKAASPDYGAMAVAAAMLGRNAVDPDDQLDAGLSF